MSVRQAACHRTSTVIAAHAGMGAAGAGLRRVHAGAPLRTLRHLAREGLT